MNRSQIGFIVLIWGWTLSTATYAGEIHVSATGRAEAAADYVGITVTVNGQCFRSTALAAKSASSLANKLEEKLKGQQNAADRALPDFLTRVSLGFQRRDEYYFDGQKQVRLCTNGWYTAIRLEAKYVLTEKNALTRLPTIQDSILELVDTLGKNAEKGEPQVWADFAGPVPSVTQEHRAKMQDAALIDAIRRAKHEVEVMKNHVATIKDPILVEVREGTSGGPPAYENEKSRIYSMKAAAPVASSGSESSFLFGNLTEEISRTFVFKYTGPSRSDSRKEQ